MPRHRVNMREVIEVMERDMERRRRLEVPTWNEADSFASGEVVEYVGPNLNHGTLFVILGLKCIGEETGEPIYYVEFFEGDEGRYSYGVHHRYLKKSKTQAKINWEV